MFVCLFVCLYGLDVGQIKAQAEAQAQVYNTRIRDLEKSLQTEMKKQERYLSTISSLERKVVVLQKVNQKLAERAKNPSDNNTSTVAELEEELADSVLPKDFNQRLPCNLNFPQLHLLIYMKASWQYF